MVKNIVIGCLALALIVSLLVPSRIPRPAEPVAPEPVETEAVSSPLPDPVEIPETVPPEPEEEEAPDPRIVAFDALFEAAGTEAGLAGAAIGFCLIGPAGERLYGHNADIAQIPASALKTLTTATALEVLGPEFRFQTRLGVIAPGDGDGAPGDGDGAPGDGDGAPGDGDGIDGDLILRGGGDPLLSLDDFRTWAEGLAEAGVKSVSGRVIGDGRFFPGSPFADFWNWGDIGNGYGSPVSGLNLEHNRFIAVLQPGEKEGAPAELVRIEPEVPGVVWLNESVTGPEGSGDGITIHGGERAAVMHLRGSVPVGEEMRVAGAVPDPERFAAFHLREVLLAAGIEVGGEALGAGELLLRDEPVPEMTEELLTQDSPPLLDIVTSIHASSDNHETECVFQILGLKSGMPPAEAVRTHWEERGLDLTGFRMVDGSGLARADHITPSSLALLQHLAATGPVGREYRDSLLETRDGTVRFKAGAMSAVRSYTGLIEAGSGEHLSFALIVNHYSDAVAVQILQRGLFEIMAAW